MKKSILLLAAAFFICVGNQSLSAQTEVSKTQKVKRDVSKLQKDDVKVVAMKKTEALIRSLQLTDEQQEQVYNLYVMTERKMGASKRDTRIDTKEMSTIEAKQKELEKIKIKEILNEEQYMKYLELSKKL